MFTFARELGDLTWQSAGSVWYIVSWLLGYPSLTLGYGEHLAFSSVFAYQHVSLFEYSVHRWLMHDKRAANATRWERLRETQRDHARHHFEFYGVFNYEPDPVGKDLNLTLTLLSDSVLILLGTLPVFYFDPLTAVFCAALAVVHRNVFNAIHIEMHVEEEPWYTKTPLFVFWRLYHFLHHLDPKKNYNVVFPFWDFLLQTRMKATDAHRKALEHADRMLWLRRELAANNLSGYIVSASSSRLEWLTGIRVDGCCVVLHEAAAIFIDPQSVDQLRIDTAGGYIVSPHKNRPLFQIHATDNPQQAAAQWLRSTNLEETGRMGCYPAKPLNSRLIRAIEARGDELVFSDALDSAMANSTRIGRRLRFAKLKLAAA
jgi:hypothetical protein